MDVYLKDPAAVIDYSIDWASTYLLAGENIVTSSWTIWPTGEVGDLQVDHEPPLAGNIASVFVGLGNVGHRYQLTNHITTDQGRTDERSFTIRISER